MSSALCSLLFKSCTVFYCKILYHCSKAASANEEVTPFYVPHHESGATDTDAKNVKKKRMDVLFWLHVLCLIELLASNLVS